MWRWNPNSSTELYPGPTERGFLLDCPTLKQNQIEASVPPTLLSTVTSGRAFLDLSTSIFKLVKVMQKLMAEII
jgi:hypothetical protein